MKNEPLFSEHWYRVKQLKPRLATDVVRSRHVYRGHPSYLLHRKSSGTVFRAAANSMELIGRLDGSLTVEQVWTMALEQQGECAPTQSEFIELLGQLHEAELLIIDRQLKVEHLFSRSEDKSRATFKQHYLNPLFLRFALIDPDKALNKISKKLSWAFKPWIAIAWIALILLSVLSLIPHWAVFRYELATAELLSPFYAVLFLVIYPLMKLVHEFSHGLVLKRLGGEVHEMGIALMVLLPIPYVDATMATLLADKRQRMLVSAAGILVECGFAAIAILLWLNTSGFIHDAALLLILIGGISTLLFNANPLLKFDGYFILADYLEIPNLAQRSKNYLQAVLSRTLLKIEIDCDDPEDSREKWLLLAYGVLSAVYRVVLMLGIAWVISKQYFFFGVLMAVWILVTTLALPVKKFVLFLAAQHGASRAYATMVCLSLLALSTVFVAAVPLPNSTFAKAVVWLPNDAIVRAASDCEVSHVSAKPGTLVDPGDELFHCVNSELNASITQLQAKLDEINALTTGLDKKNRVERIKLDNEARVTENSLTREKEKLKQQVLVANASGQFVVTENSSLIGRFYTQGAIAAYIVTPDARTVHMAVEQNRINDIQQAVDSVELVFAEDINQGTKYASTIKRQTPKAGLQLTSAALSTVGGGTLLADPSGDGTTVLEPVFDIELNWPDSAPEVNVGSHVYVKLHHPPSSLSLRLMSGVKRAFLGRVGV